VGVEGRRREIRGNTFLGRSRYRCDCNSAPKDPAIHWAKAKYQERETRRGTGQPGCTVQILFDQPLSRTATVLGGNIHIPSKGLRLSGNVSTCAIARDSGQSAV
jgi:hypothetical protein